MLHTLLETSDVRFRTCNEVRAAIKQACEANSDVATFCNLGTSEEGRPIDGVLLGSGSKNVCLIAGAHSDEPVGPETLRTFVLKGISQKDKLAQLFSTFRFIIIPHINPDGEAQNQGWIKEWPSAEAYLDHAFREPPGRDLEFGFPNMRQENSLVAEFMEAHSPFSMHTSLHGMAFSEGAMLLIERHWIERTQRLRMRFAQFVQSLGLRLHDHDRKGEKGFQYIAPGFTTTPEGQAMQAYFKSIGDESTAKLFHDSSMEFARKLGDDPLCLVTELPMFIVAKETEPRQAGVPTAYLSLKVKVPGLKAKLTRGESIRATLEEFGIRPLDLSLLLKIQLFTIQLGLETVSPES
jgi:hypothetical protein